MDVSFLNPDFYYMQKDMIEKNEIKLPQFEQIVVCNDRLESGRVTTAAALKISDIIEKHEMSSTNLFDHLEVITLPIDYINDSKIVFNFESATLLKTMATASKWTGRTLKYGGKLILLAEPFVGTSFGPTLKVMEKGMSIGSKIFQGTSFFLKGTEEVSKINTQDPTTFSRLVKLIRTGSITYLIFAPMCCIAPPAMGAVAVAANSTALLSLGLAVNDLWEKGLSNNETQNAEINSSLQISSAFPIEAIQFELIQPNLAISANPNPEGES